MFRRPPSVSLRTQVGTLVASLAWVHMLLRKSAARVMQLSAQIWPSLFKCLSNPSEEVVRLDIEALAYMASSTQQHFVRSCHATIDFVLLSLIHI